MGLERSQYMLGLALEGGGARGAFHIGAIKALLENGYVCKDEELFMTL